MEEQEQSERRDTLAELVVGVVGFRSFFFEGSLFHLCVCVSVSVFFFFAFRVPPFSVCVGVCVRVIDVMASRAGPHRHAPFPPPHTYTKSHTDNQRTRDGTTRKVTRKKLKKNNNNKQAKLKVHKNSEQIIESGGVSKRPGVYVCVCVNGGGGVEKGAGLERGGAATGWMGGVWAGPMGWVGGWGVDGDKRKVGESASQSGSSPPMMSSPQAVPTAPTDDSAPASAAADASEAPPVATPPAAAAGEDTATLEAEPTPTPPPLPAAVDADGEAPAPEAS